MDLSNYIPVPESGCWLWLGKWGANGYGMGGKPRYLSAHRESYAAAYGPIPEGMHVCHKCDTRPCINPAHLYVGTPAQNVKDRVQRRRSSGGSMPGGANPAAKLTAEQVAAVRQSKVPARELAAALGVSQSAVRHIRSGRRWRSD